MTHRWLLTPHMLMSHVWLYPRIIVPTPTVMHQSMWIQWLFCKKKKKSNQKVNDPKMTFDPTSVEITCVTLPKDHCVQIPWKYIKVCGYSDSSFKNLNKKRSLTARWPLTQGCWGHISDSTQGSLCPSLMKIHQNMWIQWPFCTNLKGHWPLDDLCPHICWGHMCDSTQGSLCPSPMGIHQCMWIQWSILQNNTYIHILMSDHTISFNINTAKARQKKLCANLVVKMQCTHATGNILSFFFWPKLGYYASAFWALRNNKFSFKFK